MKRSIIPVVLIAFALCCFATPTEYLDTHSDAFESTAESEDVLTTFASGEIALGIEGEPDDTAGALVFNNGADWNYEIVCISNDLKTVTVFVNGAEMVFSYVDGVCTGIVVEGGADTGFYKKTTQPGNDGIGYIEKAFCIGGIEVKFNEP